MFDFTRFYQNLRGYSNDSNEEHCNTITEYSELKLAFQTKAMQKRSIFNVPFHIGPGLVVSCNGYRLVSEKRRPYGVQVDSATNKEVETTTAYVCKTTNITLLQTDMKYYYVFGDQKALCSAKAVFSRDEMDEIKHFGEPSLTLLGFKSIINIKDKMQIGPSSFIYPNDYQVAGSSSFFAHLIIKLEQRQKVAMCRLIARAGSHPVIVALFPKSDKSGFEAIRMPFADDIRHVPSFGVVEHRKS